MKKLYQDIKIPKLEGNKLIKDSQLFSYIDADFTNWNLNQKGKTKPQELEVFELDREITFKEMFVTPQKMALTQEQILYFLENYKDKLGDDNNVTFFLSQSNGVFFVARVRVDSDDSLIVSVLRFEDSNVWHAGYRHRVVVPQLKLENSITSNFETFESLTLRIEKLEQFKEKVESVLKLTRAET